MVIQIRIHDGIRIKTRTYRDVVRGVNLAQYREGFYAQEAYSKWGEMVQLKGNERIVLARFGRVEPRVHKIPVVNRSIILVGRFVKTIDTEDGSFGDEDYNTITRVYHTLELETL